MKRQGFTLVELLAVIAILAILVIIALPNVMTMFNNSKKESFTTELKELFKTAEQTWMSDSMFNTKEQVYSRVNDSTCQRQLDLSGRSNLEYYIKVNKSGNIIVFNASDGTYQYSYSGSGLKIEDIANVVQISEITADQIIKVTCNVSIVPGYFAPDQLLSDKVGSDGLIEDDHGDYRYQGADVNNYATFNGETSAWRIIGLFNLEGEKRIKLIHDDSIATYSWDYSPSSENNGSGINQWGPSTREDSTPYEGADLMIILNNYYYNGVTDAHCNTGNGFGSNSTCSFPGLTQEAKNLIGDAKWYLGAGTYGDTLSGQYSKERASTSGKICTSGSDCNDNVIRTTSWVGKIGLIYPSDFGYASSNELCKNDLSKSDKCGAGNWLKNSSAYWTITPYRRNQSANYVLRINPGGYVGNIYATQSACIIRPVVYLRADVQMKGSGTTSDPYVFTR